MPVRPITEVVQTMLQDFWLFKLIMSLSSAAIGFAFPTEAARTAAVCAMVLIVFDFLTAIIAVMRDKSLRIESAKAARTLAKVLAYSAVIAIVAIATRQVTGGPDDNNGVLGFTVMGAVSWICLTESISILENITRAGILLPPGLREWLEHRIGGGKGERSFPQITQQENEQ